MNVPHRFASVAVSLAMVAMSCDPGNTDYGYAGTTPSVDQSGGASGATNPPPIPATNTNGWVDITATQQADLLAVACSGAIAEPEIPASVFEFVLDVNGTMTAPTGINGNQTKWQAVAAALGPAVAALPGHDAVGFAFFPNKDNGEAVASSSDLTPCIDHRNDVAPALLDEPGSRQRNALNAALDAVEPNPNGARPTQDALDHAYQLLREDPYASQPNKYVVLITDGQPTLSSGCQGLGELRMPDDTAPLITDIGNVAAQDGIKTFVVGSPGSDRDPTTGAEVRGWLSAAARAGGTAPTGCSDTGDPQFCHFDLSQTTGLGAALADTLSALRLRLAVPTGCDYAVAAPPVEGLEDPRDRGRDSGGGDARMFRMVES